MRVEQLFAVGRLAHESSANRSTRRRTITSHVTQLSQPTTRPACRRSFVSLLESPFGSGLQSSPWNPRRTDQALVCGGQVHDVADDEDELNQGARHHEGRRPYYASAGGGAVPDNRESSLFSPAMSSCRRRPMTRATRSRLRFCRMDVSPSSFAGESRAPSLDGEEDQQASKHRPGPKVRNNTKGCQGHDDDAPRSKASRGRSGRTTANPRERKSDVELDSPLDVSPVGDFAVPIDDHDQAQPL